VLQLNELKHLFLLLAITTILLQIFSKTIIFVNYELNKDYITKNFCENKNKPKMHCNGKCHLKKQLAQAEKKGQSPTNSLNEKYEVQFFSENNSDISQFNSSVISIVKPLYFFSLSDKHLLSVFHPPQV